MRAAFVYVRPQCAQQYLGTPRCGRPTMAAPHFPQRSNPDSRYLRGFPGLVVCLAGSVNSSRNRSLSPTLMIAGHSATPTI